jgi:PD-(D/E)XK nuclease superfamily
MAPEFGKPIHQLPLIPAKVLKQHRVHEPLDTRFRSAARLLQALWREDRDLPIGSYVSNDGKRRKLGSRISEAAGQGGGMARAAPASSLSSSNIPKACMNPCRN